MGKILKELMIFFIFITIDLHLGIHLVDRFQEFRNKTGPISIRAIRDIVPASVLPADIDNDGNDELVLTETRFSTDKVEISVIAPIPHQNQNNSKDYREIKFPVPFGYFLINTFYDQKKGRSIFQFLDTRGGDLILRNIDQNKHELGIIKLDALEEKFPGRGAESLLPELTDLDADGKSELLMLFRSFYFHTPRGIACFEPESGELRWVYYTGAQPMMLAVDDINGNGKKEIVLSTTGANNGASRNGTTDASSYVIVLDSAGKEIRKYVTGSWYTFAQSIIFDIDNNGIPDIITATESHQAHLKEKGILYIFNTLNRKPIPPFPLRDASFSKPFAIKSKNGDARIYIGDSRGRIWMFDKNLNCLKVVSEDPPLVILNTQVQPQGQGYVLARTGNGLIAYDLELNKRIFTHTIKRPNGYEKYSDTLFTPFIPIKWKDSNNAVIIADRMYVLSESKMRLPAIITQSITSGFLPYIFLLLFCNGFFIYSLDRLKKYRYLQKDRDDGKGKLKFLEIIQEIAQQLKDPISNVLWTAEKLKRNIETDGMSDFLMEDVKTLRRHTHQILKLIQLQEPRFCETKLKSFLQDFVDHYRKLADEKIKIHLEIEKDISLIIDEELIKETLANMVDKALEAMPDGGILTIAVVMGTDFFKRGVKEVCIEVEDTGYRMEKEEKQEEEDIRLFICKRIIAAHHGNLKIRSRKDHGTRVSMTIPVKQRPIGK